MLIDDPALLISISHYVFFTQLSGKIAEGDAAPNRQPYVTATSFVLATLFQATLLGSTSTCFAQAPWRIMRERPISVANIESLFQMRSNPFELANVQLVQTASLVFLIVVYTSLVPLAITFRPVHLLSQPDLSPL